MVCLLWFIKIRWIFSQGFCFIRWIYLVGLLINHWMRGLRIRTIYFSWWRDVAFVVWNPWLILFWTITWRIYCKLLNHYLLRGLSNNCSSSCHWHRTLHWLYWSYHLLFLICRRFYILNLSIFSLCLISWKRYFSITTIFKIFWWFISIWFVWLRTMSICINMLWSVSVITLLNIIHLLSHRNWKTRRRWRKLII